MTEYQVRAIKEALIFKEMTRKMASTNAHASGPKPNRLASETCLVGRSKYSRHFPRVSHGEIGCDSIVLSDASLTLKPPDRSNRLRIFHRNFVDSHNDGFLKASVILCNVKYTNRASSVWMYFHFPNTNEQSNNQFVIYKFRMLHFWRFEWLFVKYINKSFNSYRDITNFLVFLAV